ncbi:hypothetical protein ACHAXT_003900 [Thalassiosira profunda]
MIAAVDDGGPTLTNERERELSRSREAFIKWGACNAIPIECIEPAGPDSGDYRQDEDEFLSCLGEAVSSASVVLLSEGYHNCREMMTLHHRIVQHLVANFGFDIVASESGLPESRDVADYIASPDREYTETEKEEMWGRGLNKMYGAWAEGRELIEWMWDYNLRAKDENARVRIEYCGLDIGGFYPNWTHPVSKIQRFLKDQLPAFEAEWSRKIEPILDIMGKEKARYNYQHLLSPEQKSTLANLLDELVLRLNSCNEELAGDLDFEWARQSAISMQLAENYYRNYEQMSISDSGEGISKCTGLNGREIARPTT